MSEPAFTSVPLEGQMDVTAATSLVNLNTTLQTVFELQKERLQRLQTILRRDPLPVIKGIEADWQQVFYGLMDIILAYPPRDSKLFIYIKCEALPNAAGEEAPWYSISVHTNTGNDAQWATACAAFLDRCGAVCNASGGTFVHHMVSTSTCLFTLNLPGNLH